MSGVRSLLVNTKVSALSKPQSVTVLKDTATIEQALKVLADNRILSAPVVIPPDAPEGGDAGASPVMPPGEAGDILGFVDMRNILDSFLAEIDIPALNEVKLLQRMRILEDKGGEFAQRKLKDLKFIGTDGDFIHASQARSTLLELVLNGLLQPRNRGGGREAHGSVVHRIALFDSDGHITQIISQSDIIKFLHQHKQHLGELGASTVASLGLISNRVESIPPETPAIEAMAFMSWKGLSSLAVVDTAGQITGNFSVSDMRTLMSEQFGALALPVGEFLAHEHKTEFVGFNRVHEEGVEGTAGHKFVRDKVSRQRPRTPGEDVGQALVLARQGQTLLEVVELLVKHRIHRVYVVDEKEVPVGIITCTDILRKVLQVAQ